MEAELLALLKDNNVTVEVNTNKIKTAFEEFQKEQVDCTFGLFSVETEEELKDKVSICSKSIRLKHINLIKSLDGK
jgi:hypothetical protein